jgi:hypothetical protein
MAVEGTDGHQQRAPGGAEFGPHLGPRPVGVLDPHALADPGQCDGGEPRVPRARRPRPVDQRRTGPEDHGGGLHDPPLQQPHQMGPRALGMCPVVPGDDERSPPPAEREHRTERGVQTVRVDEVGVRAGGTQRSDGPRVAAARHVHMVGAGTAEVVGAIGVGRGAHGHPHAPRDQPGGQGPHMRAAAGVATAEHLNGAQRRLAVR